MKKKRIISFVVLGILLIACLMGLVVTGQKIAWGPFGFLHTWQDEIDQIKTKYSTDRKDEIIFYGASNFALWERLEGDLGEYKVQNHAFGGSTDQDLYKYADQVLYPYKPKLVFFQTGSNDYVKLSGTEEERIEKTLEYKKMMFTTFHEELPDAKFIVMSGILLPGRSEYLDMTLKINEELASFIETVDYMYFVDANDLTYDGNILDETLFENDMIHLNRRGQISWSEKYIKPQIELLIQKYNLDHLRN